MLFHGYDDFANSAAIAETPNNAHVLCKTWYVTQEWAYRGCTSFPFCITPLPFVSFQVRMKLTCQQSKARISYVYQRPCNNAALIDMNHEFRRSGLSDVCRPEPILLFFHLFFFPAIFFLPILLNIWFII